MNTFYPTALVLRTTTDANNKTGYIIGGQIAMNTITINNHHLNDNDYLAIGSITINSIYTFAKSNLQIMSIGGLLTNGGLNYINYNGRLPNKTITIRGCFIFRKVENSYMVVGLSIKYDKPLIDTEDDTMILCSMDLDCLQLHTDADLTGMDADSLLLEGMNIELWKTKI